MYVTKRPVRADPDHSGVGVAGADVQIVLAAPAQGLVNLLAQVEWSYSAQIQATGRLQIADGANDVVDVDIVMGGFDQLLFDPPLQNNTDQTAMTITLTGVAGAVGKLNVQAWVGVV